MYRVGYFKGQTAVHIFDGHSSICGEVVADGVITEVPYSLTTPICKKCILLKVENDLVLTSTCSVCGKEREQRRPFPLCIECQLKRNNKEAKKRFRKHYHAPVA